MADENAVTASSFMERVLSWIKGSDTKLTALESAVGKLSVAQDELAQVRKNLETANQTIATLTKERDDARTAEATAKAAQEKAETEAKTATETADKRQKELEAEVERKSNLIVGQRLAKLGARPVAEDITTDPTGNGKAKTWTERSIAAAKAARGQN